MLLSEVIDLLGCEELLALDSLRQLDITACFAADLMSEVLAFCGHGAMLVTGLTNIQSVHTADMADLHAIVFVNGKRPEAQVLALARERGIPLLTTKLTMFEVCGRLHEKGVAASRKA